MVFPIDIILSHASLEGISVFFCLNVQAEPTNHSKGKQSPIHIGKYLFFDRIHTRYTLRFMFSKKNQSWTHYHRNGMQIFLFLQVINLSAELKNCFMAPLIIVLLFSGPLVTSLCQFVRWLLVIGMLISMIDTFDKVLQKTDHSHFIPC